jgi:hypothetical protein
MTFSEAYKACNSDRVVYYKNEPHLISTPAGYPVLQGGEDVNVYTTAGGMVRLEEGIAHIRPLNSGDNDWFEVEVPEICLNKSN